MTKKPSLISDYAREIDPVEREFVRLAREIALKAKQTMTDKGMKQGEFAALLGKKESEVSRLFAGMQNLTLYSIARLHVALGDKLFDVKLPRLRPRPHEGLEMEGAVTGNMDIIAVEAHASDPIVSSKEFKDLLAKANQAAMRVERRNAA